MREYQRPLVGLTGRRGVGASLGAPHAFADSPLDVHFAEYAAGVARAGGVPVQVPFCAPAAEVIGWIDALVLTGGEDVDPSLYEQSRGPHVATVDATRDAFELELLEAALREGLPVLGICRGLQLLNVARGGSLVQHLDPSRGEPHADFTLGRHERAQRIRTTDGSTLQTLLGDDFEVNSFHHQAIDACGDGVKAVAYAADGVIEAVELEGAPVIGVQWHPEALEDDTLFGWLVAAARAADAEGWKRGRARR